jgi:hypothetical protein
MADVSTRYGSGIARMADQRKPDQPSTFGRVTPEPVSGRALRGPVGGNNKLCMSLKAFGILDLRRTRLLICPTGSPLNFLSSPIFGAVENIFLRR